MENKLEEQVIINNNEIIENSSPLGMILDHNFDSMIVMI